MLKGKTIVLGITGGIAAYKAADLASKLTQAGAKVETVMTDAAKKFITPLTLRNITHRPVVTDMFELSSEWSEEHVALAEAADAVIIAPATANTIARLAAGIADDMLGTVVLATESPVIIAPAMNDKMYSNTVTQQNVAALKKRGFTFIEPEYGRLASGKQGKGRLADTPTILAAIEKALAKKNDLDGKRIVVTAGGTQEPIDPVRHISNRSSGKMGYALAEAARDRGALVILVTAPAAQSLPDGVEVVKVRTAAEMKKAVVDAVKKADALIMAAAPADYQPKAVAKSKIKKESKASLTLELVKTPDILTEVKGNFIKVGFAAESENMVANAKKKLANKGLDLVVANDITQSDAGFDVDTNRVTLIDKKGKVENLPLMSKRDVAEKILDRIKGLMGQREREGKMILKVQCEVQRYDKGNGYCRIIFPKEKRSFFPNKGVWFSLNSEGVEDKVRVMEDKPSWIPHIHLNKTEFFKRNPELIDGQKLIIDIIGSESAREYHLEIVK